LRVIARDQHRPLAAVTASLENAIAHAGGPAAVTKP
jgi:hypothetical protein